MHTPFYQPLFISDLIAASVSLHTLLAAFYPVLQRSGPHGPSQSRYSLSGGVLECVVLVRVDQTPQCRCWTENRPPTKNIQTEASCGQHPVTTDEGLEDDQHKLCSSR
ncbi:hypothetical protein AOLI_G00272470 [Acnodon oligacanthus]